MSHPPFQTAGKHLILDFWGAEHLRDIDIIESAMREAAKRSGAVLLDVHLHRFADNQGITGVALLAESHISVHTWPEHGYAAFDVFVCGDVQAKKAVDHLTAVFAPTRFDIKELDRGVKP